MLVRLGVGEVVEMVRSGVGEVVGLGDVVVLVMSWCW